ncbi:SCOC [Lepeophtheirus salmonis]|uniref:SCOC n=1 Tax=Lepeophtheirus salmonis TaxID=72036 RepID=A0A0K2TSR1_LEPSM|nr:short coiled-coil protein B-like [Lepeophtheirus salmonis]CAB4069629.1 SCOC [Lepeophtheirus salmonis]CAF3030532.1 SCOC [Lepeophtheirus salmonis]
MSSDNSNSDLDEIPMADEGVTSLMSDPQVAVDEENDSEEQEEKARLIAQVLELQNTLDDLSCRVDNVKEENLRLRSENQVLGQYIENLMAASSVFQPANNEASCVKSPTTSIKK